MKDLESKLSLESASELGASDTHFEPGDDVALWAAEVTAARLVDVRFLLVEILNELRTIRALHCNLPWPEHAQGLEVKGA